MLPRSVGKTVNLTPIAGQLRRILEAPSFRRFLLVALGMLLFAMILGIGVWLIVHGLLIACLYLSVYWFPARRAIYMLSLTPTTDDLFLPSLALSRSSVLVLTLHSMIWLGLAGFVCWLVWRMGFPGQNLIYGILAH